MPVTSLPQVQNQQPQPQVQSIPMTGGKVPSPHVIAQSQQNVAQKMSQMQQNTGVLGQQGPLTQKFGSISPLEKFSGGFKRGISIAVPEGTKLSAPPGTWKVAEAYDGAQNGFIGNPENKGYGNSVVLQNSQTGETLRFNHLSKVGVQLGQTLGEGEPLGLTGKTGNTTGPHLALDYTNGQGQLADPLSSPYAQYLFKGVSSDQSGQSGSPQYSSMGKSSILDVPMNSLSAGKTSPGPIDYQSFFTPDSSGDIGSSQNQMAQPAQPQQGGQYVPYKSRLSSQPTDESQPPAQGGGGPNPPPYFGGPNLTQQAMFNGGQQVGQGIKSLFQKVFPPQPDQPLVSPVPQNETMGTPTFGQPPTADQIRQKYSAPGIHQISPEEMAIVRGQSSGMPSPSPSPVTQPNGNTTLPKGGKGFDKLVQYAVQKAQEEGFNPAPIVSQMAIESARGTSPIFKKTNNLLGIGAYDNSPGKSAFRFNKPEDSIDYYFKTVKNDPRYAEAYAQKSNPQAFIQALAPVYASDPNYVQTNMNTPEWRQYAGGS